MTWPHCGRVSTKQPFTSWHMSATHGEHITALEHTHMFRFPFPTISNNKTPVKRNLKAKLLQGTEIMYVKRTPVNTCLALRKKKWVWHEITRFRPCVKFLHFWLWWQKLTNVCSRVCAAGVRHWWQSCFYIWSQIMCKSENSSCHLIQNLRILLFKQSFSVSWK